MDPDAASAYVCFSILFPTISGFWKGLLFNYTHAVTHVLATSVPSSFTAPCCWEIFDDAMRDGKGRYMR